jgi:hypothetical protein
MDAMWRPTMFLLCLIAALSATPLRQAEAAGDFARSRAELGEDHVEMVDGGVGDDADVGVVKAESDGPSSRAMTSLTTTESFLTSPLECVGRSDRSAQRSGPFTA